MKSLIAKLPVRSSLGIYWGEQEFGISRVAHTPLGPVETHRVCEPSSADLDQVLASMVRRHVNRLGPTQVAIALPAIHVYHSTRPLHGGIVSLQPQQILRESFHVAQVRAEEMVVDVLRARPGERDIVGVAACEQNYFAALRDRLKKAGCEAVLVEPAPCALLRVAQRFRAAPRGSHLVLRVFLGASAGLGILVSGGTPLHWRNFVLPRGDEASAILSVARSMEPLARYCGVDAPIDVVLIHGRPDLHPLLSQDWLEDEIGSAVQWVEAPALDPGEMACGVAMRLANQTPGFDLAKSSRPRPRLRQIMPWGQFAFQASLLGCLAMCHLSSTVDLQRALALQQTHNSSHRELGQIADDQLKKEKTQLESRLSHIGRYLDTRLAWHRGLRELVERLPPLAYLTSLHGVYELEQAGKRAARPKKSLVLRGNAIIGEDGATPAAVEKFVDSIREMSELRTYLPEVELNGLQQTLSSDDRPIVKFSVTCLPKPAVKKAAPAQP